MPRFATFATALIAAMFVVAPVPAYASDLGTTGLIDTPTARMRPDGEFAASIALQPSVDTYAFNYQATPWLETTFRYSIFDYGRYDRSYSVKLRLWPEGEKLPQLAVGVQDLLGTGVWGAEYLVANKQWQKFDLSLGLGWGRLADRGSFSNPLAQLDSRFDSREFDVGRGGTVRFDSFFSGPDAALFGGLRYAATPSVSLLAEYSPDLYLRSQAAGVIDSIEPWNLGVQWEPTPGLVLGVSHQLGQQWAFSITSRLDSTYIPPPRDSDVFIPAEAFHQAGVEVPGLSIASWYDRLRYDMGFAGLVLHQARLDPAGQQLSLVMSNPSYQITADAVRQTIRLADRNAPNSVRNIDIIVREADLQMATVSYQRTNSREPFVPSSPGAISLLPGRTLDQPTHSTGFSKKLGLSAGLDTRVSLFDPDDPLRYQLYLKLGASLRLPDRWRLRGIYGLDIENNFDEITRSSNSLLPRVRSDSARYLQEGATGLASLYLNKQANLSSDIYYRLYGGVLESMYSGVGGELLVAPWRSRLAVGVSANWVQQRDFNRSFDHLDYNTVTAFASAYWASPFYNYDLAVHVGKYLARDVGATFELRRTFDNGWQVGAWATFTDVPFDTFGEGSFDKGIFFRIPLGGAGEDDDRGAYTASLRSIQRDGGQRLESFSGNLWWNTRSARYDALDNYRERMLP